MTASASAGAEGNTSAPHAAVRRHADNLLQKLLSRKKRKNLIQGNMQAFSSLLIVKCICITGEYRGTKHQWIKGVQIRITVNK